MWKSKLILFSLLVLISCTDSNQYDNENKLIHRFINQYENSVFETHRYDFGEYSIFQIKKINLPIYPYYEFELDSIDSNLLIIINDSLKRVFEPRLYTIKYGEDIITEKPSEIFRLGCESPIFEHDEVFKGIYCKKSEKGLIVTLEKFDSLTNNESLDLMSLCENL